MSLKIVAGQNKTQCFLAKKDIAVHSCDYCFIGMDSRLRGNDGGGKIRGLNNDGWFNEDGWCNDDGGVQK
ncbi:MAG: hypothetical protein COB51_08550 [Moraxellaceae bacterium]|nr:MAG: hypothetical protein COB51_08550 [Moraxellaceae bacterium]